MPGRLVSVLVRNGEREAASASLAGVVPARQKGEYNVTLIRRRLVALAVGSMMLAGGVMGGAQAASASTGPAVTASRPPAATAAIPLNSSNYQNCMFRVDVPYIQVVAGNSVIDLYEGSELYSTDAQSYSDNLWWLYSLALNRYVWVDWHDIALEYCDE